MIRSEIRSSTEFKLHIAFVPAHFTPTRYRAHARWYNGDYARVVDLDIEVSKSGDRSVETGTGAPEGRRVGGLGMWIMNAMTPKTAGSTNYYWGVFETQSPEMTALVHREISTASRRTSKCCEAQQMSIERFAEPSNVNIPADAGGIQSRRLPRTLAAESCHNDEVQLQLASR